MPFSGKLPSRQSIEKAIAIHGVRIKSTPEEFAVAVFETAAKIDELQDRQNRNPGRQGRSERGERSGRDVQ